jgi:hypothetical protein
MAPEAGTIIPQDRQVEQSRRRRAGTEGEPRAIPEKKEDGKARGRPEPGPR